MGYLSEVTRRRIAAALLVVGTAVGLLAIADVGPFSNPATEEEKAQGVVVDFFDAAHSRDFKGMCSLLTPAARTQFLQRTAALLAGQVDVHSCAQGLEAEQRVAAAQGGATLRGTRISRIVDSRVSGNRAAVDVELNGSGYRRPLSRTFQLELVRNEWRIAGSIL